MPTPAFMFDLISNPIIRLVGGWDWVPRDVRWIAPEPDMVCLEVGAGGGFFSTGVREHLGADATLITLDLDPVAMRKLADRSAKRAGPHAAGLAALAGDGFMLPFADETIDCVFYSYSIEELPDPVASIEESLRVLKPGGQIVLFLWKPIARKPMRTAMLDRLARDCHPPVITEGPQNLRGVWRKRIPAPTPPPQPATAPEPADAQAASEH